MGIEAFLKGDRAVSETLGYIIVFGIVFTCIGILVLSGNQIISNAEDRTMFQGLQQSFSVLSSDLRKTAFDASPMRTLQIKYDGSMHFSQNDFQLLVCNKDKAEIFPATGARGAINFKSSSMQQGLSLENDAVIENYALYSDSSVMSQTPRIYVSGDSVKTLVVNNINLQGSDASMGGSGVATIRLSSAGITPYPPSTLSEDIVIFKIKTNNQNAWKNYFTSQFSAYNPSFNTSPGEIEVTLTGIDQVQVVVYDINVAMS